MLWQFITLKMRLLRSSGWVA